jgi:ferredoxin-NADP reductase
MRMDAGSDFAARFLAANRTGFYCRVLQEGVVKRWDAIALLSRDLSSATVSEVLAATQFAPRDPAALRHILKARDLPPKWQSRVRRMIGAEVRRALERDLSQPLRARIDEILLETADVLSLWLQGADSAALPPALPGQYLTLIWPDGLSRTYSLSATQADQRYRITVKLVRDPQGVLGRASARIAKLRVGDMLAVGRPRGSFHPDVDDDTPLVLAAGGIGVTPIMNMVDRVTRGGRRNVLAAFGMRRRAEHPLFHALRHLAAERQGLKVMLAYSQHDGEVVPGLPPPKFGRLTAADLLPHAAVPLAEVFLCGPGDFIRQLHNGLVEAGINPLCIRYESFGPSTLLPGRSDGATDPAGRFAVSFTRSEIEAIWSPASGTLLNLAEAAGISPTFGCRSGSCGLCRIAITKGSVRYVDPIDEPDAGYVLPCCAVPHTDCQLDL